MTRRRWIADEVKGNTAALVGEHALHLSSVLRAEVGQEFDVAAGDTVRRGRITSISSERVEFMLGKAQEVRTAPHVTLVVSIFKFDRMEWAIEKCTEIGVARIVPVIAGHTNPHLGSAALKRHERWRRIALQAAEQSRRTTPPEIAAPVKLKDLGSAGVSPAGPQEIGAADSRIVLAESEGDRFLRDALTGHSTKAVLAIGPEGGWTDDELQWFRDSGWVAASLGNTILRAETAAIVAAAIAFDTLR